MNLLAAIEADINITAQKLRDGGAITEHERNELSKKREQLSQLAGDYVKLLYRYTEVSVA